MIILQRFRGASRGICGGGQSKYIFRGYGGPVKKHPVLFEFVACVIFDIDLHKQLEKGTSARLLLNGPLGLLV